MVWVMVSWRFVSGDDRVCGDETLSITLAAGRGGVMVEELVERVDVIGDIFVWSNDTKFQA